MHPLLRLLRPHQWTKNALLLSPMVFAHRLTELSLWIDVLGAVASFSLLASAVYVLNDRLDLETDRRHPVKRDRPLAAGTVPLSRAPALVAGLAAAAFGLAALALPRPFLLILTVYLAANLLYSGGVKRVPALDVIFLTLMFVLRILAGGVATGVPVSDWLLSFSLFFFLSLALAKRAAEWTAPGVPDAPPPSSVRGYRAGDLSWIGQTGVAAGMVSVLVLALYVRDGDMIARYASPRLLWLACPLLAYWNGRVWLLALRGEMEEDPVHFALHDPVSYAVLLLTGMVVQVAYLF